jgi:hypothetical protein
MFFLPVGFARCHEDVGMEFFDLAIKRSSRPLYGQIKEFHSHVLVATGKSDWKEKHVEKMTVVGCSGGVRFDAETLMTWIGC